MLPSILTALSLSMTVIHSVCCVLFCLYQEVVVYRSKWNFYGKPKDCLNSVRTLTLVRSHIGSALCPRNFSYWTVTAKWRGHGMKSQPWVVTTPLTSACLVSFPNEETLPRWEMNLMPTNDQQELHTEMRRHRDWGLFLLEQPAPKSWQNIRTRRSCISLLCPDTQTQCKHVCVCVCVCLYTHSDGREGHSNYSKSFLQGT